MQDISLPDYPVYSASTSALTAPNELLIGGEWLKASSLALLCLDSQVLMMMAWQAGAATPHSLAPSCTQCLLLVTLA